MYMPGGRRIVFGPNETNLEGIRVIGSALEAGGAAIRIA